MRAARVKVGQPCGRPGSGPVSPAPRAARVRAGSALARSALNGPRVSRVNSGQPSTGPCMAMQACARSTMHAEQTSPLFVLGPRPQPRAATDQARTRMAQPINQTSTAGHPRAPGGDTGTKKKLLPESNQALGRLKQPICDGILTSARSETNCWLCWSGAKVQVVQFVDPSNSMDNDLF